MPSTGESLELPCIYIADAMYIVRVLFVTSEHLVLESSVHAVLGRDDRRRLGDLLTEDLGLDEPGQCDCELVADELLGRDLEDLCGLC